MYRLSRWILILGVLVLLYWIGVVVAMSLAVSPIITAVLVAAVLVRIKRRGIQLTTLGSGRVSEEGELRHAGLVGATHGLTIGRLCGNQKWRRLRAIWRLLCRHVAAPEACLRFLLAFRGSKEQGVLVRLPTAVHTAVFAPTGVGKGVSCVVPFLLTSEESSVVIDFKGELATLTADHRRRMGQEVVILDPYGVVKGDAKRAVFNPLDFIDKNSPTAIDDCWDIAKALVVRTGEEKDPHFNDAAETWIATMLAATVNFAVGGYKSLQTVREAVTNPEKMKAAIDTAQRSEAWDGMLARMGNQLSQFKGDEAASVMTTTNRHLRWLDTPAIAANSRSSTFEPSKLTQGKMTVYLVPSLEHARVLSPWLRMNIGALLRAVVKGGLQEKNKVHFILDEAASLGHMDAIDDALDKYRGYGVRCQFYFQSVGQLSKCFPKQEQTLLSNTTQVFFGVNDMGIQEGKGTAEYISNRLGEATILVESGGTSRGGSMSAAEGRDRTVTRGSSWNENRNWAQQARKLLKPEEVLNLPPRTAITFTPGVPPIMTTLIRWYEEPWLTKKGWFASKRAALGVFARALFFLVWMSLIAGVITAIAVEFRTVERINYAFHSLMKGGRR